MSPETIEPSDGSGAGSGVGPGAIRAVVPAPLGGRLVMSGFPGLETGVDGSPVFDPASCAETVGGLVALGARQLTVLVELDELDATGFQVLGESAAAHGLDLRFAPIPDFGTPDAAFLSDWARDAEARAALFRDGGTFAVACQYGAGRSGLIACLCLIEQGASAETAIAQVRAQFPDAVESAAQEAFLRAAAA